MGLNTTCPVPAGAQDYGVRGTAWIPLVWSAAACSITTIAIALSLVVLHLRRYRAPREQRQIIRIVFCVIVYAVIAFFEVASYEVAQYIDPLGDLYEAFGLWYVQTKDHAFLGCADSIPAHSTSSSSNTPHHPAPSPTTTSSPPPEQPKKRQ